VTKGKRRVTSKNPTLFSLFTVISEDKCKGGVPHLISRKEKAGMGRNF